MPKVPVSYFKSRISRIKKQYRVNYCGAIKCDPVIAGFVRDFTVNDGFLYYSLRTKAPFELDRDCKIIRGPLSEKKGDIITCEIISKGHVTQCWFPFDCDGEKIFTGESDSVGKSYISCTQIALCEKKEWDPSFRADGKDSIRIRVSGRIVIAWNTMSSCVRIYEKTTGNLIGELNSQVENFRFPVSVASLGDDKVLIFCAQNVDFSILKNSQGDLKSGNNLIVWDYNKKKVNFLMNDVASYATSLCVDGDGFVWGCDRSKNMLMKYERSEKSIREIFKIDLVDLVHHFVSEPCCVAGCKIVIAGSLLYLLNRADPVRRFFCFDIR